MPSESASEKLGCEPRAGTKTGALLCGARGPTMGLEA